MDEKKKGLTFEDFFGALGIFFTIALLASGIGLLFIQGYRDYGDMDYSDFTYEELTYVGYTKEYAKNSGPIYRICFKEYDIPFTIDGISKKELDIAALNALEENAPVQVYYYLNQYSKYEIGEISSDEGVLLSLSGFVEANQKNQKAGMVGFPIIGAVFELSMAAAYLGTRNQKEQETEDHEPMEEEAE